MPLIDFKPCAGAGVCALWMLGLAVSPAHADTLTRSVEVRGSPTAVWAAIGPFCAIADWHPAIATCSEDGRAPSTRTLVTKDGKARFIELETRRDESAHRYSYSFISAPVPVTGYASTLQVTPRGNGVSTVTWRGSYRPDSGQAQAAHDALSGIYETGLAAIQAKLAR